MKKSEELKLQASQEENDSKALGLETKALREHRWENFIQNYEQKLKDSGKVFGIIVRENDVLLDVRDFGKVSFYPKANKILIHKQNKWIKPGLKWLIHNILRK